MIATAGRGKPRFAADGRMSEPQNSAGANAEQAAGTPSGGYRVLARKYRPASFDDLIGQDAMVRTISNAFEAGRIPQAWILTGVRGVGKTTTARILARALNYELPDGSVQRPDHRHAENGRARPGDHGKPAPGRAGDGRRLAQQRRRRAPDQRRHPLRADERALQGLYPRRSAHAVAGRLQRAVEDAGGAAAARQIHLRHHRNPQGAGDGAVALPAFRPAPRRCRAAGQASRGHRRQGKDRGRAGGAGADRARGGRLGARFAVIVRPGHCTRGRQGRAPRTCGRCSGLPTACASSTCSKP